MLKDICIVMVAVLMVSSGIRYAYLMKHHRVNPALATWVIFLLGTVLSFVTYMIAENRDVGSGILNTMDMFEVGAICLAVLIWGNRRVKFSRFERWYLLGIGLIVAYGFLLGDAWGSNLFVQILIGLGYVPTIQKMISTKTNTESFTSWGMNGLAGVFALVPALVDGNTLAAVYAGRTILFISLFLLLMIYYQFVRPRRQKAV